MERYVELGIARGLGIAANLQFVRLSGLASAWLGERILLGAPPPESRVRPVALLDELRLLRRELGGLPVPLPPQRLSRPRGA